MQCDALANITTKHQNPEMKMLVKEIIERYEINRHMRMHDKLWIADQNYLDTSITKILTTFIKGELSILLRFALFTGLRGEEISCSSKAHLSKASWMHFSKEDVMYAQIHLRRYLSKGYSYHEAAREVAKHSPILFLSLRYQAYYMNKKIGYHKPNKTQHKDYTIHGSLISKCKEKLKFDGYDVIDEQNKIRKFIESKGSKGNPDLVAIGKNGETLLVEVAEPEKDMHTLVKQLDRYQKVGKVVIVFPMDTSNTSLWGLQSFQSPSGINTRKPLHKGTMSIK